MIDQGKMTTIGSMALRLIEDHEDEIHEGKPCMQERANFVAFLIHKFGLLTDEGVACIIERAFIYERQHKHHPET